MGVTCAVGPCDQEREAGSSFCPKHGPSARYGKKDAGDASHVVCPHCHTKGREPYRRSAAA